MPLYKETGTPFGPMGLLGAIAGPTYFMYLYAAKSSIIIPDWLFSGLAWTYVFALGVGVTARVLKGHWSPKSWLLTPLICLASLFALGVYLTKISQFQGNSWGALTAHLYNDGLLSGMKSSLLIIVLTLLPCWLVIRFFNGAFVALVAAPKSPRWLKYQFLKSYRIARNHQAIRFLARHPYLVKVVSAKEPIVQ